MKKLSFILTTIFCLLLSLNTNAQGTVDYFVGKWDVYVTGIPSGDTRLTVNLERKEGKITGNIIIEGTQESPISSTEERDGALVINFSVGEYYTSLYLKKVDEDHVTGNAMGQYTANGLRIKEVKTQVGANK